MNTSRPRGDPSTQRSNEGNVIDCPPWRERGWGGDRGGGGCRVELLDVVQDGFFNTVYSCRDIASDKKYLLKKVHLHRLDRRDQEYCLKETPLLSRLCHRHILKCYAGWEARSGAELWLLNEAAAETLEHLVREKALPPPQVLFEQWLYQLASALQYLHEFQDQPILHRNLKPSNIMVVPHYILKLTDFGFSKELADGEEMTRSQVGTARFMSPQMVNKVDYNAKTDMWSLGITAVFIATQQEAISADSFDTLFRKIREGQVRGITGQYSKDLENLVHSLLQENPQCRPFASEFITSLRLCSNRCATPATADSYPGRQMVPQNDPDPASGHPVPRQRSSSRKTTKSAAKEKRPAACQTTQSLLRRGDTTPGNPATDDPAPGQPTTPASTAAPSAENLPLSLIFAVLNKNPRPRTGSAVQARDLRRRPVRASTVHRGQTLPTAAAEATSDEKSRQASGAGGVQNHGNRHGRREVISRDKMPASCREQVSSARQSDGAKHAAAAGVEPLSRQRTGGVQPAPRAEAAGPAGNSQASDEVSPPINNRPSGRGDSEACNQRSASLRNSLGRSLLASSRRPSEDSEHAYKERVSSLTKPSSGQVRNYGGRRGEDRQRARREDGASTDDGYTTASASCNRPADESFSDTEATFDLRASSAEDIRIHWEEQEDEIWSEMQSTVDTLTSETDTLTSEPQLINTFPGAFSLDNATPADRHLPHPHSPSNPAIGRGDRSKHVPRRRSEWDGSRDAKDGGGAQGGGRAVSGPPRASVLLEVPVAYWPENMRQYWTLANGMVTELGADIFFNAVKLASLFSEREVRQWLQERGVSSAGQVVDKLRRLRDVDAQLDEDTVLALNGTLMRRPLAGDDPA